MAYGFENKMAKNDEDIKLYLNEGMFFEAWTMIIRNWTGDWNDLNDQLEKEIYKKSTVLSEDEQETLQIELLYQSRYN